MAKLLEVLHELVETGNTVVVIEHNLEVIKTADWIIDLGPEGGDGGGEIVAAGTPEDIVREKRSYTGAFLKPVLARGAGPQAQEAGRGGGVGSLLPSWEKVASGHRRKPDEAPSPQGAHLPDPSLRLTPLSPAGERGRN